MTNQYKNIILNKRDVLCASIEHLDTLMKTPGVDVGTLPQTINDAVSLSAADISATASLDEVELLPSRIHLLTTLSKSLPKQKQGPFLKDHPMTTVLLSMSKQLAELTSSTVTYQQVASQLDLVTQQYLENGGTKEKEKIHEQEIKEKENETKEDKNKDKNKDKGKGKDKKDSCSYQSKQCQRKHHHQHVKKISIEKAWCCQTSREARKTTTRCCCTN